MFSRRYPGRPLRAGNNVNLCLDIIAFCRFGGVGLEFSRRFIFRLSFTLFVSIVPCFLIRKAKERYLSISLQQNGSQNQVLSATAMKTIDPEYSLTASVVPNKTQPKRRIDALRQWRIFQDAQSTPLFFFPLYIDLYALLFTRRKYVPNSSYIILT